MKISFIIPGIGISGGNRVVFEYANNLKKRGHDVSVIYPIFGPHFEIKWHNLKKIIVTLLIGFNRLRRGNRIRWFELEARLVRVPFLSDKFIEDSDIIVATRWDTAYHVNAFNESKGKKFYLIQGYETWHGPEKEVDNSYRLPLNKIVVSSYLEDVLENKLKEKVITKIINGVNLELFHKENGRRYGSKRILMQYSENEVKGYEDGVRAFQIIKREIPDSKLILFGVRKGKDLSKDIEFHESVNSDQMRRLYNSCDILLVPSREEGFGLPPMEAMACGCAVVTTNFGAVPDYAIHRKTALISEPNNPEGLARNAISLLRDEEELKRIAHRGYKYIRKFTWEKATERLESVFLNALY